MSCVQFVEIMYKVKSYIKQNIVFLTLLNCPSTYFRILGGESCSKDSKASIYIHFCSICFNAVLHFALRSSELFGLLYS